MLYSEIKYLVGKEVMLELKQKYVLNGILLYLVSTVFVTYLAFENAISPETWNSLLRKTFIAEKPYEYSDR